MASSGEDHLTTLLPELLTQIVKTLPVREICRLRAQNHRLRDFIDVNQQALVKDAVDFHRARLRRECDALVSVPGEIDWLDAVLAYTRVFGPRHDAPRGAQFPMIDKDVYTAKDSGALIPVLKTDPILHTQLMRTAYGVAFGFEQLASPSPQHSSSEVGSASVAADALESTLERATKNITRFLKDKDGVEPSAEDIAIVKEKLKSFAPHRHTGPGPYSDEPRYPVTAKLGFQATLFGKIRMPACCEPQHASIMQHQLGLPKLEDDGGVAYCAMSRFAVDLVDELSQEPAPTLKLKLAAIIAELYIW